MTVYSFVEGGRKTLYEIDTFINGQKKVITSMWSFVNGSIKQLYPNPADETWTLYSSFAPTDETSDYSIVLPFGKYKFVFSGGGGAGSSAAARQGFNSRTQTNGSAGEELTYYLNVPHGSTKTAHGVIGKGAAGSFTSSRSTYSTHTVGAPGTGYESGSSGGGEHHDESDEIAVASGSGGGSTSLEITEDSYISIAKGGNGGRVVASSNFGSSTPVYIHVYTYNGGTGGSGGTTNGTGAAGGTSTYGTGSGSANTSNSGSNGYVYIYKSNIYPTS